MNEQAELLKRRTKQFALQVLRFVKMLPKTDEARIVKRQLLKAATSVAANYRATCRARSKAEFTAKIGVVLEEADEVAFWLELIEEGGIAEGQLIQDLHREADELLLIFAASRRTARENDLVEKARSR